MTRRADRVVPLTVLVVASLLLVASVGWVASSGPWPTTRFLGPGTMMGAGGWSQATGPVDDLAEAREAAERYTERWDLHGAEVMEFSNGYYVALAEPAGDLATEVLVDRDSGAVHLEFGPAMMWNTEYGMHGRRVGPVTIGPDEALTIATRWLAERRPGETADRPDSFPGYYTLHTVREGRVDGMLSVNAASGAVWYHSWHGDFVAMSEENHG